MIDFTVLKQKVLDAIYPPDTACFLCNAEANLDERRICAACGEAVRQGADIPCPEGLDGLSAGLIYEGPAMQAIYRLKYGEDQYLAEYFARLMKLPEGCMPDAIIPVPLHGSRLRARGFNQSALLAQAFSDEIHVPMMPELLARVKETTPQASLNKEARVLNVKGAFRARGVQGRVLVLVDDICTTGNTLAACADALREKGAKAVYAACACATVIQRP